MEKISILLVDDHKLIRDSWSYILNSDSRFQVIGATGTADEAVSIAKGKHPKIILMDLNTHHKSKIAIILFSDIIEYPPQANFTVKKL